MSIKLRAYKKYIYLRILIACVISILLMRFFVIFDYLFDIAPNRSWKEIITRFESYFNLGSMHRVLFSSYTISSVTCVIELLAFILCSIKITNLSFNKVSIIVVKPTINIDNKLEGSNPFLYSNKTRSLRE